MNHNAKMPEVILSNTWTKILNLSFLKKREMISKQKYENMKKFLATLFNKDSATDHYIANP